MHADSQIPSMVCKTTIKQVSKGCWIGEACDDADLHTVQGASQRSIPDYIVSRTQDDHYQGPKCDLVRLDARTDYLERRQDFRGMEPMFHCGTLVLFNDVCDPVNCHLYNTSNCYHNGLGNCGKQHSQHFEGPTMVLEELIRQGLVEKVDSFFYKHEKFYKSWALARVRCRSAKLRPLPAAPLFKQPEKFAASMRGCFEQGGCSGMLLSQ